MKVKIDIYRGWEISFDTSRETFYCHSERYDRDQYKISFAATKKWIDDFIKENENFKPIWFEIKPDAAGLEDMIKIIGIRKDGNFIYENEKGEKKQLPGYYEEKYILYYEENEKYKIEASKIYEQIKALQKDRKSILEKMKVISLSEYKSQLFEK